MPDRIVIKGVTAKLFQEAFKNYNRNNPKTTVEFKDVNDDGDLEIGGGVLPEVFVHHFDENGKESQCRPVYSAADSMAVKVSKRLQNYIFSGTGCYIKIRISQDQFKEALADHHKKHPKEKIEFKNADNDDALTIRSNGDSAQTELQIRYVDFRGKTCREQPIYLEDAKAREIENILRNYILGNPAPKN